MADITDVKSWWEKPEGKFATKLLFVAGAALAVTATLGWASYVLPMVATCMATGFSIGCSAAGLFGLYLLFTSKTVKLYFRLAMYHMASLAVTVDPIGVAREQIGKWQESLVKMEGHMTKVLGKKQTLDNEIRDNEKLKQKQLKECDYAKSKGLQKEAKLAAEQVGMLTEANATLMEVSKGVELVYRRLDQMHEVADYQIKSKTAEVNLKERTWKTIKEANSAMKSAMSVLQGDPDERARFEQSLQTMADDIGNKTGEMQQWMDRSDKLVNSTNLQRDLLADEGFKQLANEGSILLTEQQVKQIVVQTEDHNDVLDTTKPVRTSSYSQYLKQ